MESVEVDSAHIERLRAELFTAKLRHEDLRRYLRGLAEASIIAKRVGSLTRIRVYPNGVFENVVETAFAMSKHMIRAAERHLGGFMPRSVQEFSSDMAERFFAPNELDTAATLRELIACAKKDMAIAIADRKKIERELSELDMPIFAANN